MWVYKGISFYMGYKCVRGALRNAFQRSGSRRAAQDSSKGGAVETRCSDLHYIIGYFIT